ncbi:MAG: hypothetical protein QME81_06070 [bacterium]|nr:hypothetical protein [bacterium]
MQNLRGNPSSWLLKNSVGYPDFLFTILTYAMLLLIFVSLFWVGFGVLAWMNAGTPKADTILKIMDSMKAGLVALAGIVFGLAGSYTVRRFKKDNYDIEKKKLEQKNGLETQPTGLAKIVQSGLTLVETEEDI